jgi:SET domain-containing protein
MAQLRKLPPWFEVKESLIADAGKGLFVKRSYRQDQKIGRYRGRSYARKEADSLPAERKPYLFASLPGQVIDGYSFNNHMRWVNHSTDPNAYVELRSSGVLVFRALRDIEAGEELYIDYEYDPKTPDKSLISSYIKLLTMKV